MTIDRLPASHRIARLLQEKIERQEYQEGQWLPTERELASEFGADRGTVRAALSHLAERRLIERQPGRRPWVTVRSGEAVVQEGRNASATILQTIAAIIPQPPNYPALSLIQRGILRVLR